MVRVLHRAIGAELPIEIIGHWPWTAGVALVAERFVAGRVALAGDAAHLFTPTGGFGMNTGMDDASNLAWKLAALVQGWGGAGLLPSYETERKPIAQRNTTAARELNKQLADMPDTTAIDGGLASVARRSGAPSAHIVASLARNIASIGVQLGARYDGSPIVAADGAPPADDYVNYTPSGVPGGRAPHYWINRGPRLWRLAVRPVRAGLHAAAAGRRRRRHADRSKPPRAGAACRSRCSTYRNADARDLYGADLALIRPDQYLAWRGNAPPADPDRLLAQLVGAT